MDFESIYLKKIWYYQLIRSSTEVVSLPVTQETGVQFPAAEVFYQTPIGIEEIQ